MQAGDTAPDVSLADQTGAVRPLSAIANGRRTVLFFYPAAMTTGCTKESCHFRDLAAEFGSASRWTASTSRRRSPTNTASTIPC